MVARHFILTLKMKKKIWLWNFAFEIQWNNIISDFILTYEIRSFADGLKLRWIFFAASQEYRKIQIHFSR